MGILGMTFLSKNKRKKQKFKNVRSAIRSSLIYPPTYIRCHQSLTYLPTPKSDVIFECSQRHIRAKHNKETPFKCSFEHCDKSFTSQRRCNNHEAAIHDPNFERFKCPHCPETFAYKTCLERHMQMFHQE